MGTLTVRCGVRGRGSRAVLAGMQAFPCRWDAGLLCCCLAGAFSVWFCLGSWAQAGMWLRSGSTPDPPETAAALGWHGPPLALPVFQQVAQGCFHLLGCLCQTWRFPCCPWRSSVLCAAATGRDGAMGAGRSHQQQRCRLRAHLWAPLGWPPLHCPRRRVAASALLPAPRIPGSIPAGRLLPMQDHRVAVPRP